MDQNLSSIHFLRISVDVAAGWPFFAKGIKPRSKRAASKSAFSLSYDLFPKKLDSGRGAQASSASYKTMPNSISQKRWLGGVIAKTTFYDDLQVVMEKFRALRPTGNESSDNTRPRWLFATGFSLSSPSSFLFAQSDGRDRD